ncbi:MAG: hypothetical protein P1U32_08015 [Legionellaceae bacterium]|nr:hypothetical protein [Legionellaceae bacterium]
MNELMLMGLLQGLVLAIITYGVMIPLRLLNFADLTAEGSYPFGGAICAVLMTMGMPPMFALLIVVFLAGFVGVLTALIHLKLRVNTLLAGIIVSTMLYSVNLRLMGKPNLALFNVPLLFSNHGFVLKVAFLLSLLLCLIAPLSLLLKTEFGLRLRAVGLNVSFSKRQGISHTSYTLFGLFLGNAYIGLAGGLIVQLQQYMDINLGVGIVIHALASLMIGECMVKTHTMQRQLLAPLVGAIVYQQIQGLALFMGFAHSDLKLLTGLIVLSVIALRRKAL